VTAAQLVDRGPYVTLGLIVVLLLLAVTAALLNRAGRRKTLELLRDIYWQTPETDEWIDINDRIAEVLRDNGGIFRAGRGSTRHG
jgi:hypothetical protein